MKKIISILFFITSLSFSQYSLNVEHIGGASRAGEENIFRASLRNNGTTVNTIERKIPFDVPFPAYYLNESTGTIVLTYAFDGFAEVYNAKGIKTWAQNFFKEMGPNYERTISVALGSTTIAFLTSDVTLSNAMVHAYKVNGAKEWATSLPYSMGNEIAMSRDEQTIVAGSYLVRDAKVYQASSLIGGKGVIEGSADILFRKAAFSDDDSFIALASEREVAIISNGTKKEIGRTGRKTGGIITDVLWDGNMLVVQESNVIASQDRAFSYADPTFVFYSKEGVQIAMQKIDVTSFKRSRLRKNMKNIEFTHDDTVITLPSIK